MKNIGDILARATATILNPAWNVIRGKDLTPCRARVRLTPQGETKGIE